jgi:hypothetical protein
LSAPPSCALPHSQVLNKEKIYVFGELLAMENDQQNGLAAAMNCFPLLGVFDWEAQEGYLVETGDEPGTYRMNVKSDLTVRLVQTEPGPRPVVAICKFDKVGEKVSDDIFQFKPRSKLEVIKKKSSNTMTTLILK